MNKYFDLLLVTLVTLSGLLTATCTSKSTIQGTWMTDDIHLQNATMTITKSPDSPGRYVVENENWLWSKTSCDEKGYADVSFYEEDQVMNVYGGWKKKTVLSKYTMQLILSDDGNTLLMKTHRLSKPTHNTLFNPEDVTIKYTRLK